MDDKRPGLDLMITEAYDHGIQIFHGDCLDAADILRPGVVTLLLTSSP